MQRQASRDLHWRGQGKGGRRSCRGTMDGGAGGATAGSRRAVVFYLVTWTAVLTTCALVPWPPRIYSLD